MKPVQRIHLFLSSPGDVEPERAKVHAVAEQVNRMLGDSLGIVLEVIDWKTHIVPDMGRPQEVINRQVRDYDIFVGILWKRFGTPTGKAESGTEEEFNIAYANWQKFKRPRILFYFSQMPYMPKNPSEGSQFLKVLEFKAEFWEQQTGLVMDYQTPEEFSDLLREHLGKVLHEWFKPKTDIPHQPVADFTDYLKSLKQETMYIDVRGLAVGQRKETPPFFIDKVYIPLKTSYLPHTGGKVKHEQMSHQEVLLEEVLKESKVFIKGDPGSGKTTFLRLIVNQLCKKRLGDELTFQFILPDSAPLPIYVRLGLLGSYIQRCRDSKDSSCDSPEWLLHYLEKQSLEKNWNLAKESFRQELKAGRCVIFLDGLDEASNHDVRVSLSRIARNLVTAYPDCKVVMTSRPAALTTGEIVPLEFHTVEIARLDDKAIEDFLTKWCSALYSEAPEESNKYKEELRKALRGHREIRRMSRTPVMLTALAVVHWNQKRLPEQRAELYEAVLYWLFQARKDKEGRLEAKQCRELLSKLALAMFTHPKGRQRQVSPGWAADKLASEFNDDRRKAENFLYEEMIDSGIIVERNTNVEYWHLSFQEYLAAREIAGLTDKNLLAVLFKDQRLYKSEWREALLLLAGILCNNAKERLNNLIDEIIKRGPSEKLPDLARMVGLLGGMEMDLSPFNFKPSHPEYPKIVRSVMGIFDKKTFRTIPVQVRIEATDVLGRVGDPRFDREEDLWVHIPAGRFWMGAQKSDPKGRNYDNSSLLSY